MLKAKDVGWPEAKAKINSLIKGKGELEIGKPLALTFMYDRR